MQLFDWSPGEEAPNMNDDYVGLEIKDEQLSFWTD